MPLRPRARGGVPAFWARVTGFGTKSFSEEMFLGDAAQVALLAAYAPAVASWVARWPSIPPPRRPRRVLAPSRKLTAPALADGPPERGKMGTIPGDFWWKKVHKRYRNISSCKRLIPCWFSEAPNREQLRKTPPWRGPTFKPFEGQFVLWDAAGNGSCWRTNRRPWRPGGQVAVFPRTAANGMHVREHAAHFVRPPARLCPKFHSVLRTCMARLHGLESSHASPCVNFLLRACRGCHCRCGGGGLFVLLGVRAMPRGLSNAMGPLLIRFRLWRGRRRGR
jgi:hypothetical protein